MKNFLVVHKNFEGSIESTWLSHLRIKLIYRVMNKTKIDRPENFEFKKTHLILFQFL